MELLRETRSFYVFATFLLDEIAYAFVQYFALPWSRVEATHAHLTQHFHRLCAQHALVIPHADMGPLMRDLTTRLDDHPTTIDESGHESVSHHLSDMIPRIEQYIVAMIEVFAVNMGQSVFRSTPLAQHR